ncbi:MAG: hypothetical protein K0R65_353 [Crocinitomicaceae bacterium]|jgi:uncharacterized repeat protein (TIGR01451 family)|nr:hypothetical protein [Crocinitomicaceae bacterium]
MKTKFLRFHANRFKQFMTVAALAFLSFQGSAQGNVRMEIPNPADVPTVSDQGNGTYRLSFSDPQLTQLLSNYTVTGFGKEFPMFQEEERLKNIYFISYSNPGDLFADLSNTSAFPLVENIGIGEPLSVPTDYTGWPSFDGINVPQAWNITESTPGVKLGVFDERFTDPLTNQAPHLDASVEYGTTNAYMGYSYHSDGVASTISATPNDGLTHWTGLAAGIGYNSRLYVSSVYYPLTLAIQDQIARGMRAINVSMATGVCSGSAIEQLFYDKVAEKRVIVVCASGNGQIGYGVHIMNNGVTEYCMPGMPGSVCHPDYTGNSNGFIYPAAYNNVLSVASISTTDNLYGDFSSYNANNALDCDGNGSLETPIAGTVTLNNQVDVLSPPSAPSPNGHGTTSIAAPVITGAIGLMLSVNPNLDVNEIIDIFNQTGVNVTSTGSNPNGPSNNNSDYYQNGNTSDVYKLKDEVRRIDVEAAVIEAKNRYEAWLVTQAAQASQLQRVNAGDHVNDQVSSFSLNWVDYDNDNDLDIFNGTNIASAQSPTPEFLMFENQCNGPEAFGAIDLAGFEANNSVISKIGWGDFDNDGDKDFVGFNASNELIFYQNSGSSSFTQSVIGTMANGILMRAGAVADFNADGNLDFIVGPRDAHTSPNYVYAYQGNGNGTFTATSNGSDLFAHDLSFNAATAGDVNGDGNQDIAMTGASGTDFENLYYGDGNFGFTKAVLDPAQVGLIGYGVNMVDYDNDTDLDLFYHCYPHGILFNNLNNGKFFYVDNVVITNDPTVANSNATWGDYDNDGDQDVYVPSLQTKTLYNNERGIIFSQAVHEAASQASEFNHETGNSAFGDGDGDGDLDLYASNFFNDDLNNYYYVNQGNTNNWIKLLLTGANTDFLGNSRKTSLSAEGTEVTAMMTSYTSFIGNVSLTQTRYVQTNDGSPHDVHFGFGDFGPQVSIRIEWPSGLTETFLLDVNQCYKITEGTGTYTNDCACQDVNAGNEVSGNIGLDANLNCNCDDDANSVLDEALNDIWVEFQQLDANGDPVPGEVYYTTTGPNGAYSILLPDGDYLVQPYLNGTAYDISNNCSPLPVNGPVENYTVSISPDAADLDFCLQSTSCDIDMSLYPVYTYPASAPCPGVEQELCLYIENNGNAVQNPQFELDLGPNVTIVNATSSCGTPTVTAGSNLITLNPATAFGSQDACTICVSFIIDGALNEFVTAAASVNGSCQEQASWTEMISCSYDPNDKLLVTPESCGPENNIDKDEALVYRVRFQNTGNAPAVNVIIEDQLDEKLDLSTFQLLEASHTVSGIDVLPDNRLQISFENIQLPAAMTDEAGSQGYVIFSIHALADAAEGTVVDNTAFIFFDLNSAIVTNTTLNTLRDKPFPDAGFEFERSCDVLAISYDFEYTGDTPDGAAFLWNFGPNATPATSTAQNPDHILFSQGGPQNISLTVIRYGCEKTSTQQLNASSPVGCNGSTKKVMLCKNGNEVCVPLNAAAAMIANAGYCVGECDKKPKKNKSIVQTTEVLTDEIRLFPNPGSGLFQVVHSGTETPVSVTVSNSLGEIILVKEVSQASYTVDLTQEANGIYFFTIKTDSNSHHYRAVKQ